MELAILYSLSTHENYLKYIKFVPRHLVGKETYTIMTDMKEWYGVETEIDWPRFSTWFKVVKHAGMKIEQLELYDAMFRRMETYTPTGTDLETIHALIGRDYAVKISEASQDVADGASTDLAVVDTLMEKWRVDTDSAMKVEDLFVTEDISEIMATVIPDGGMNWRLPELNLSLGPIRDGDFIIVGARPGAGKTTMLASESTFLAEQMIDDDKYVLWFCNEEVDRRVKYKVMQACLGITNKDFIADPIMAEKHYLATLVGQRIKIIYQPTLTVDLVERVVKSYEGRVGLIIFDQLYKFQDFGSSGANEVSQQGKLFSWARGMSRYAPVITAHQLKGTAHGVMHPEMDQLYGSTTLVQGACDAIVMIGEPLDDEHSPGTRGIYVPRNKLIGDLKSDGKFRNAKFEVTLKHEIVRYKGAF